MRCGLRAALALLRPRGAHQLLRVAGNKRAELITTTGKGFRQDGRRDPYSWSIVDEPELARWLLAALARAN
ncbi:MAG TPA: hypothetical protein VF710_15010 [Longimicrobium sp.]|jgi:hypothetical protein